MTRCPRRAVRRRFGHDPSPDPTRRHRNRPHRLDRRPTAALARADARTRVRRTTAEVRLRRARSSAAQGLDRRRDRRATEPPGDRRPDVAAGCTVVDGLGEGHTVALLLSRPGRGGVSNRRPSVVRGADVLGRRPSACPSSPSSEPTTRRWFCSSRLRSDSDTPETPARAPRRGCRRRACAPAGRRSPRPSRARHRPAPRPSRGCCA